MIVCPVCEHEQAQAVECDVCGKRLLAGAAAAQLTVVPLVEGLEPTLHAAVHAGAERLPEVEPTRYAPTAAPSYDPVADVEPTRAAPVDVDVLPAPDLERNADIAADVPTALPSTIACRYCRTPAMPDERICARCGMRLPVYGGGWAEAASETRTCSCGTPVRGSACPNCGARR
jgi:hypothetical protein